MPKLWSDTVEEHRREVREAVLVTAMTLVAQHGLRGVTMSRIAEQAGVGRATLYKYFPDVETILLAWHLRQVEAHLAQLVEIRDRSSDPSRRLTAVLEAYAVLSSASRDHHDHELAALLHRQSQNLDPALRQVHEMVRDLLAEAAHAGEVRDDVPPEELAAYCLHALGAAAALRSQAAVRRLTEVTIAGLRPQAPRDPESDKSAGGLLPC